MREYKGILSGEDVPALMKKGCQRPECETCNEDGEHETNELYLSQACHPGAGVSVLVLAPDHPQNPIGNNPIAIIECRECGKHVGSFLIGFEDAEAMSTTDRQKQDAILRRFKAGVTAYIEWTHRADSGSMIPWLADIEAVKKASTFEEVQAILVKHEAPGLEFLEMNRRGFFL